MSNTNELIVLSAIAAIAVNSGFTPRQVLGLLGVMEFGYHLIDNMTAIAFMDKNHTTIVIPMNSGKKTKKISTI